MSRFYVYARQSIDHAEGIDRQLARCRMLCDARDWPVEAEFVDNATSATKRRGVGTQWVELLAVMEPGDVVVAVDVDRLLRSLEDLVDLQKLGVRVLTVDGEIDTTTADGEFRAAMLASIARFETRRKRERQLRANDARKAQARPLPTRRRYGYESDGVTPRAEEAKVVQDMFAAFADGASVRSITLGLVRDGIEPTTGKQWSTRRVRDTLNNPAYGGELLRDGEVVSSSFITPVVDPELAAHVRAVLADEARRTTPGSAVRHQLSGIARCAVCGESMFFMRDYRCRADPTHPSIRKGRIEPVVERAVVDALFLGGGALMKLDSDAASVTALSAKLTKLEELSAQVLSYRADELLSPAVTRQRLLALKSDRDTVEAALDAAREKSAVARLLLDLHLRVVPGEAIKLSDSAAVKAEIRSRWSALDLETQRTLIRALVDVEVAPGRAADRVTVRHLVATALNVEDES
ncbi:recombinase family protein [Agrococcus terreus]|uniref:Site-specific recombinase DNA invertase Pin n=1 Tax=Agrococcus terreus TaxID=574649 RepID=A0ABQ2KHU8_9MICO|nr:recombinase family protein [Agrococcus terreus]GGN82369.1 site-specific recombinase DNA invertase Pin [Agrococcus terreus]